MKTIFKYALIALLFMPVLASAVAAPTGLAAGTWVNSTLPLFWTNDATVAQWYIYVNGTLFASPVPNQTALSGTTRSFILSPLAASTNPWVINMRALATGAPLSAVSASITVTASTVPVTYVMNAPGTSLSVSGTTGGSGAATAVTVISSVLPAGASTSALQTAGNITLSSLDTKLSAINANLSNVTVNTHAISSIAGTVSVAVTGQPISVAQSGAPWPVTVPAGVTATISGGVSVTNPASAAVQVAGSITNSVTVLSIIGGQPEAGKALVNSRTLRITRATDDTYDGVSITTSVPLTITGGVFSNLTVNTHAVTQGGPWTVSGSVGVTSGVAGLTVTASQGGGFWGVSVLSQVDASSFKGVSIVSDTTTRFYGVTVTSGVAGISVTASISGGVSVTNPASAAVQIAGSITNTVAISSTALNIIAAGVTSTGTLASNIEGNVASGVATAGNPVGMGGRAATTFPVAVADGQRVEAQFTKAGKLVTMNQTVPELVTRTTTTISASTAETTILALLASTFWDIDSISVINTDNATNTRIDFRSTTGGPVVFSMGAAKAYGGFVQSFTVPMPQDAVNTNWTAQCSASTTDIRINIVAHQRK